MPRRVIKRVLPVEDEPLGDYELVLVFSPAIAEDGLDAAIEKVSQLITEGGGTPPVIEQWGKRKLAYTIKRFMEGNYVLTRFKLKPGLTRELEANLHISEEILRHLLIRSTV